MKKFYLMIAAFAVCFLLLSCSSKEESTVNKMSDLTEKIDKAEDPASLDWDELDTEFAEIEQEAAECHFSKKESNEYYRLQGKYQAAKFKYVLQNLPDMIDEATDAASSYMKGVMEGLGVDSVE